MRFRLLGPLDARRDGAHLNVGGPKQRLVLAHLLLRANSVVATDKLIDHVWGAQPPQTARNTLQSYVARLRTLLDDTVRIAGRPPGYVLEVDPTNIDAARFEDLVDEARRAADPRRKLALLREALGLFRGSPLEDLSGEPSLRAEIARLEELRLQATEGLVAAQLDVGAGAELVAELEALIEEHPFRERLWGQLVVAYYRAGRQAEALHAADRAREVLRDELGIDPSIELQALRDRVLRQDPTLLVAGASARGYELRERIGQGTFGAVYRGTEPQLGRDVAVKVIRPDLSDRIGFIHRFEAEARLVARLEHPHIVPLYDYWREPGAAFLVMRLLRGGNLRELLGREAVGPDEISRIVEQVTDALAFAHRSGVVHLDIKPENVLLDQDGNAYLSDFGIAREAGQSPPTVASPRLGSTPYESPEQAQGGDVGPYSDVFSLGMVLRELVDQEPPGGNGLAGALDPVVRVATASDPTDRYRDGGRLAAALAEVGRPRTGLPPTGAAPRRNPYKGLASFTEADAPDFFGREDLVRRLVQLLADGRRFLAIVGPSGSGKSSVVHAGLVPAVRSGLADGTGQWLVARMTPGPTPLEELRLAIANVAVEATDSLPGVLRRRVPLGRALAGVLPPGAELLLVVDQLEEAFTLASDEDERGAFLDALASVCADGGHRLRLVVTLRADFFDRPLRHPRLAELFRAGTEPVTPLTGPEFERAVAGPAANVGVEVSPGVITAIREDLGAEPGALPLLQYTMTELFDQGAPIDLEAYRAVGGVRGALVARAEARFEELDEDGRAAARQLFLRLVTLGEGTRDTRRRATLGECRDLAPPGVMDSVLATLGAHRLLSFDRDPGTRARTVEVAHEALLVEWGRLRGWIDAARDDLRAHQRLAAAADEWDAAERDASYLLRGARLDEAMAWAERSEVAPRAVDRAMLEESVSAARDDEAAEADRAAREEALARRSRTRLRALVVVLAMAAVVSGVLATFAEGQRAEAQRAADASFARELASSSTAVRDEDPDLGLLLAMEAMGATDPPVPEAVAAVHGSLLRHRTVLTVPGDYPAAFSPDGSLLATALGADAEIRLWDVSSGDEASVLRGHTDTVVQVEFTADGTGLVSSSIDGTARRWNVGSATEACRYVGHRDGVLSLSMSRDSSRLVTRGFDGTVRVWDVASCDELLALRLDVLGVHVHPDGRRVALAVVERGPTVVDLANGEEVLAVDAPGVRDVRFSPDGSTLAFASGLGPTRLVDADTGVERARVPGHEGLTETVDFSPDGRLLATGGQDGRVRVFDVATGESRVVLAGVGSNVEHVTFTPDSTMVAGAGTSGRVLVWDVTPQGAAEVVTIDAGGPVEDSGLDPDGTRVLASTADGVAAVWEVETGDRVAALDQDGRLEFVTWWGPRGDRILTGALQPSDGSVVVAVWDRDGSHIADLDDVGPFATADLAPEGDRVAVGTADGVVRVWEVEDGVPVQERDTGLMRVDDVAWSPDGDRIAAATQADAVWVWDLVTDRILVMDGHANVVNDVVWGPDGSRVASAGEDGSTRIWSGEDGSQQVVLEGHVGTVTGIDWSSDGRRLVSGSVDGTMRLWDPATATNVLTVATPGRVSSVSISADGRLASFGGEDGLVRVVTLDVVDLRAIASNRVTRALTDEECRMYLHKQACPGR